MKPISSLHCSCYNVRKYNMDFIEMNRIRRGIADAWS